MTKIIIYAIHWVMGNQAVQNKVCKDGYMLPNYSDGVQLFDPSNNPHMDYPVIIAPELSCRRPKNIKVCSPRPRHQVIEKEECCLDKSCECRPAIYDCAKILELALRSHPEQKVEGKKILRQRKSPAARKRVVEQDIKCMENILVAQEENIEQVSMVLPNERKKKKEVVVPQAVEIKHVDSVHRPKVTHKPDRQKSFVQVAMLRCAGVFAFMLIMFGIILTVVEGAAVDAAANNNVETTGWATGHTAALLIGVGMLAMVSILGTMIFQINKKQKLSLDKYR